MKLLLNWILINITSTQRGLREKIKITAATYLGNTPSAALLTDDASFWNDIKFEFPLTVRQLDGHATDSVPVASFIIDLYNRRWSPENLHPRNRDFNSKYVFLADSTQRDTVTEAVRKLGPCHSIIITVKKDAIVETTSFFDKCKGIGVTHKDLPLNCVANVSFLDLPPNVIFKENKLYGFEGRMAQTACEYMGFNPNYINRHETGYGLFHPPSGLQGDAGSGTSLISFGALYAFHYRYINAETIFGCHNVPLQWAVPMEAGPSHPTWFIILFTEFSNTVWVAVMLTAVAFVPLSARFRYTAGRNPGGMEILGLILGIAIPSKYNFHKSLTAVILFFGFMIGAYYQAILSSKLTVPTPVPEITKLKQLADSELMLTGPPTVGDIMNESAKASSPDSPLRTLMKHYVKNLESLEVLLPRIADTRSLALLRHGDNLYYNAQKIPGAKGRIHMVEESVYTFKAITLMPKHSCLATKFQRTYHRLCESGLGAKWFGDLTTRRYENQQNGPKSLDIDHIEGFLYLLFFGWSLATSAFLIEMGKIANLKRGLSLVVVKFRLVSMPRKKQKMPPLQRTSVHRI